MNCGVTITYGERAENHVGMEIRGDGLSDKGLSIETLRRAKKRFEKKGVKCQLINLTEISEVNSEFEEDDIQQTAEDAYVLIIRNGVSVFTEQQTVFEEQMGLTWDVKYYDRRRSKVLNKHARYNLCYDDQSQEADYENGKGTIYSWEQVPETAKIRNGLSKYFGKIAKNLKGEGNQYHDYRKCGIGYHGDAERRIVIAARLGPVSKPIYYQCYYRHKPVGYRIEIEIEPGDMYAMGKKAVGTDWKCSSFPTWRHATGSKKYVE